MTHLIRQQPNGDWFVYSTATESIILYQASREDVIEFMLEERRKELEANLNGIEKYGCKQPKTNRTKTAEDCIEKSSLEVTGDGELVEP